MKHFAGTWLSVLNHFPSSDPASLDQVSHWKPDPPACVMETSGNAEPFGTGVDTHTQEAEVGAGARKGGIVLFFSKNAGMLLGHVLCGRTAG